MGTLLSLSPGEPVDAELTIKRSRFICYLERIKSEEDARTFIDDIRQLHPTARHHCTAFRYQSGDDIRERSNDDGEPAGTAGRPMLAVLNGHNLVNVCAVVVRYFGGVKLGTGGLVRAYSDSVTSGYEAAKNSQRIVKRVPTELSKVECPIADIGRWEAELRVAHDVVDVIYGENAEGEINPNLATITVATQNSAQNDELVADVAAVSQGDAELLSAGTVVREYQLR
ncbi:MAG TPA: YigZ family protein [Corynebacteriales bacterium]|nr:YigZ family protein [Mycobacteriales bacterium]